MLIFKPEKILLYVALEEIHTKIMNPRSKVPLFNSFIFFFFQDFITYFICKEKGVYMNIEALFMYIHPVC